MPCPPRRRRRDVVAIHKGRKDGCLPPRTLPSVAPVEGESELTAVLGLQGLFRSLNSESLTD